MSGHLEHIICPECNNVQRAEVKHTRPWWTFIHECDCGYIVTESDWNKVDNHVNLDDPEWIDLKKEWPEDDVEAIWLSDQSHVAIGTRKEIKFTPTHWAQLESV